MRLFGGRLPPAQSMVEEIPLPANPLGFRHPTFERSDDFFHRFSPGEFEQAMKVIRHGKKERTSQIAIGLADLDRFHNLTPNIGDSQLIGTARLSVDRDEKDIALRVGNDAWRDFVRKAFSTDGFHGYQGRDDPARSSLISAEWRQGLCVERGRPWGRGRISPRRKKVIRADQAESALPIFFAP